MRFARRLARKLAADSGQVTLELFIATGVWFASVLIFANMFVLLGTSMMVNTGLARAAQQVSALGCLSTAVKGDFTQRQVGLGASQFTLVARSPATHSADYRFDRNLMEDASGVIQTGTSRSADCSAGTLNAQRDQTVVTNAEYIWLKVTYTQHISFFPGASLDVRMQRTALVISQSLRGDPPGA